MVRTVSLPSLKSDHERVPEEVVHTIASYITSFQDLVNFSMVNKGCYNDINNDSGLWIGYLKQLGNWEPKRRRSSNENSLIILDDEMTPIDCLSTPTSDPHMARERFIRIYSLMNPIVKGMLIDNYTNFQNLKVFRQYDTPLLQAELFSNISKVLILYKRSHPNDYKNMLLRFDTILDLFVGTVTREIGVQLEKKKFEVARSLVSALGELRLENSELTVDPLNALLEFFLTRYASGFSQVTDDHIVDKILVQADDAVGVVNGYKLDYDRIDEQFGKIQKVLDEDLSEVASIFHGGSKNTEIDELPIVLKIIETFLSSYLIGGLIDRLMVRAREIDEGEDMRVSLERKQMQKLIQEQRSPLPQEQDLAETDDTGLQTIDEPVDESVGNHINVMNANSLFFQAVPYIHSKLISMLQELKYPETMAESGGQQVKIDYVSLSCEFVNFYYEPYLLEFSEQLPKQCHKALEYMVQTWESSKLEDQRKMEQRILSMVDDSDERKKKTFDILSTFTNIFTFKAKDNEQHKETENERKVSKMAANLEILQSNVESIKSLVSVDLTVLILQHVKNTYDLLIDLTKYSTTEELNKQLYSICSDIFIDMLTIIIDEHVNPGFAEALNTLRNYDPTEFKGELKSDSAAVAPLTNFTELVNVGDLILQMVGVFYQRELVTSGIVKSKTGKYRDFLSMTQCEKEIAKFETILDTYVADGLDISIGVIMNEVNFSILENNVDATTYTLKRNNRDGPSEWVCKVVNILDTHFRLLEKSIDKGIMDVFKQEIGERFVAEFIKLLTKRVAINEIGAFQFITDVNYLYDFFQKSRMKSTVAYFVAFKQISQMFLVDCSEDKKQCKELGKLVIEIGRENGMFTPEEVYQFVSRRADWPRIKRSVDKIMYGFTPEDCVIT